MSHDGDDERIMNLVAELQQISATEKGINKFISEIKGGAKQRKESFYSHSTFSLHYGKDPAILVDALKAEPLIGSLAGRGATGYAQDLDKLLIKLVSGNEIEPPEINCVTIVFTAINHQGKARPYYQFQVRDEYWQVEDRHGKKRFDPRLKWAQKWDIMSLKNWLNAMDKRGQEIEQEIQEIIIQTLTEGKQIESLRGSTALETLVWDMLDPRGRFPISYLVQKEGVKMSEFCSGCVDQMIYQYERGKPVSRSAPTAQPRFNVVCGSLEHDSNETYTLAEVESQIKDIRIREGKEPMEIRHLNIRAHDKLKLPRLIAVKCNPQDSEFGYSGF